MSVKAGSVSGRRRRREGEADGRKRGYLVGVRKEDGSKVVFGSSADAQCSTGHALTFVVRHFIAPDGPQVRDGQEVPSIFEQRVASILACPQGYVTSANQTDPSSRPQMCIMRDGSCSLKPAASTSAGQIFVLALCRKAIRGWSIHSRVALERGQRYSSSSALLSLSSSSSNTESWMRRSAASASTSARRRVSSLSRAAVSGSRRLAR